MKVKYLGTQAKSINGKYIPVGYFECMSPEEGNKMKELLGDEIELIAEKSDSAKVEAPKEVETSEESAPMKSKRSRE